MASALTHISIADLKKLNGYALSTSPASQDNLSRAIRAMALANDSHALCSDVGYLVVGGKAIAHTSSRQYVEGLLDVPAHQQHPAVQAVACVSLLRGGDRTLPGPARWSRGDLQHRLCALLIEYPVLMDPRLVFAFAVPWTEWTSLPLAIAESSYAKLPSAAEGMSRKQLQCFACNPCVASGLAKPTGNFRNEDGARAMYAKTPIEVALSGLGTATPPPDPRATRGGFLVSLMELNDIARTFTGRPLVTVPQHGYLQANLYAALAKVILDLALNEGAHTSATMEQVQSTLALRSLFALDGHNSGSERDLDVDHTVGTTTGMSAIARPSLLANHMAFQVSATLFAGGAAVAHSELKHSPVLVMQSRIHRLLQASVDLGIQPSMAAGGRWLVEAMLGDSHADNSSALPSATQEHVLGLLLALHEVGVQAPAPLEPLVSQSSTKWSTWKTWYATIEAFKTATTMQAVYASHVSDQGGRLELVGPAPGASSALASARARRRSV